MVLVMEKVQCKERVFTRSFLVKRVTTNSFVDHTKSRPLRDHSAKVERNVRSSLATTTATHHDILLNCGIVVKQELLAENNSIFVFLFLLIVPLSPIMFIYLFICYWKLLIHIRLCLFVGYLLYFPFFSSKPLA